MKCRYGQLLKRKSCKIKQNASAHGRYVSNRDDSARNKSVTSHLVEIINLESKRVNKHSICTIFYLCRYPNACVRTRATSSYSAVRNTERPRSDVFLSRAAAPLEIIRTKAKAIYETLARRGREHARRGETRRGEA